MAKNYWLIGDIAKHYTEHCVISDYLFLMEMKNADDFVHEVQSWLGYKNVTTSKASHLFWQKEFSVTLLYELIGFMYH